jgi:hypothetical protein
MSAQLTTTGVVFPDSTTQTTAATGSAGANGSIVLNNTQINTTYTIASGTNGLTVGPISLSNTSSVSVAAGQKWVIF